MQILQATESFLPSTKFVFHYSEWKDAVTAKKSMTDRYTDTETV